MGIKFNRFSKKNPKCRMNCGNYARTDGKKFDGLCDAHYGEEIDSKSNQVWIIFLLVVIGIVALFK